ncbi:TetR/AcrR family transcriptional regulator [Streptomyces sp. TP-A0874]|uniref:TetR/AcrR family transcriptional regulator n=1 Tax=Streptomyces sp. TP-A0874 TaxID=549819 RepID=UPI00085339D0|nr:TetR family transcriptional regulator [Streptomyces sp. TP-A0874]
MTADQEDAPAELARLWRLRPSTSGLGRPAALDTERVVRTGVELADRAGLRGATLPKIAKELGVSPMSLYRHVGSKEELLVLMRDSALGTPPELGSAPGRWRAGLREWSVAQRRLNHERPWLPRLPITGAPVGPHEIAWLEAGLEVLSGTELDWAAKVGTLTLLSGYVRQASLLSQEHQRGREETGMGQAEAERAYARTLERLVTSDRFPQTARLLSSGLFEAAPDDAYDDPVSDPDFVFGLERVLDGIAVAVGSAAGG